MNSCYAFFRLPFAHTYTEVRQSAGEVERLSALTALNGCKGFVIAPFQVSPDCPILLIRPDHVTEHAVEPVPAASIHQGNAFSEETRRDDYATDFACFHEQLQTGHFSKIVLARRATLSVAHPADPRQLFLLACHRYPRLFISLVAMPGGDFWLTATPEILLEGTGAHWRTVALAGTMQLEGEELNGEGESVRWSTKNIQEQRYVATYIASTLEQMGVSYHEEGPRTVRAANLVHLRSDFTFSLPDSSRVGDMLHALHPTPAVCGLPKQATFQFIAQHEHASRQYYSGFMGPLNLTTASVESTHLYVSLRCMHIIGTCHHLYAGGGLLKDSIEEQEWQETEAKMQTMKDVLR